MKFEELYVLLGINMNDVRFECITNFENEKRIHNSHILCVLGALSVCTQYLIRLHVHIEHNLHHAFALIFIV